MKAQLVLRRTQSSFVATNATAQISHLSRVGRVHDARKVFEALPYKPISSWNSMVKVYFENRMPREAQHLFDQMPERNIISLNGLITGYANNGMIQEAKKVFDAMPEKNVRSSTAMMKGYIQEGMVAEAESLFWGMPDKNEYSWTVMLGGLIQDGRIDDARRLYDEMPVKDTVAMTNMIGGLCSKGRVDEAREIFDEMPNKNVITWTTMIQGYGQNNRVDIARKLFEVMPEKNEVTWTNMLLGYTRSERMEEAEDIFEEMTMKPIIACNAMIIGYGQSGETEKAKSVFDQMTKRDDTTWKEMIKLYERKGFGLEALELFTLMQKHGVRPSFPSLISVLSVCASLASLDLGKQIHARLVRSQFDFDVYITSVLMTMYVKCGEIVKAKKIFDNFASKDIVMWNSIISAYSQHGLGEEALSIFNEMSMFGTIPDEVTFVAILSACSYSGKVEEGLEIFESMESKYHVKRKNEHYSCMVDMLGRAGRLDEAMKLIESMTVRPDAAAWGSLLGACRNHSRLDLAEIAANNLIEIEPENSGTYILLSNTYASQGKWAEAAELRRTMRMRNISKSMGCSWTEIDKRVHIFSQGDVRSHPEHEKIVKMMEKLDSLLRGVGYNPDVSFALHDVDDEEKEDSLRYHSERLAVAYGLLKVPEGVAIRVMKNLRVCGDCHVAIELISKVTGREIVLRDANRFHRFNDGRCSCRGYW